MKRSETPRRPVVGRSPENRPASAAALRAFVHDVVNPIAAIRISVGTLRARARLTERETSNISRIEAAATTIIRLVTNLGVLPRRAPGPSGERAALPSVNLYLLCCEIASTRRLPDGNAIHCRAVGDPRGHWDRRRVTRVISALLDHALANLETSAQVTLSVTGMTRHVLVDIHGLGRLSALQRRAAREIWSGVARPPGGVTIVAGAAPGGGMIVRLRFPRREP